MPLQAGIPVLVTPFGYHFRKNGRSRGWAVKAVGSYLATSYTGADLKKLPAPTSTLGVLITAGKPIACTTSITNEGAR